MTTEEHVCFQQPVLGEFVWHQEHKCWRGSVAGEQRRISIVLPKGADQYQNEWPSVLQLIDRIVSREPGIRQKVVELLPSEFDSSCAEKCTKQICITSIDFAWPLDYGVAVWIDGGEALGFYEIFAQVDDLGNVVTAHVP